jgi:hypothetical protein
MSIRKRFAAVLGLWAAAFVLAACGSDNGGNGTMTAGSALPQGSEPVDLNPADFTTNIDNPYWPMAAGSRWVYREVHPGASTERVVVTVTDKIKMIANGIEARVVRDVVSEGGQPVEVTDDWYAQDKDGNVWYLGEATTEYENGKPKSTKGSFEAGVDGAQPGIIVPADPKPGLSYREEYYKGKAEDEASVVSLTEQVEAPHGHFTDALMTRNVNPLEPKVLEFKFYARGIGPVTTVGVSGGSKIEELVSYTPGK